MTVEGPIGAVALQNFAEAGGELRQPRRINCSILDEGQRFAQTGNGIEQRHRRFATGPNMRVQPRFDRFEHVIQARLAAQPVGQFRGLAMQLLIGRADQFHEHERLGPADDEIQIIAIFQAVFREANDPAVEQLDRRRRPAGSGEHRFVAADGRSQRIEVEHDHAAARRQRQQMKRRFGDAGQRSFRADDELRQVEIRAGKSLRFHAPQFGDARGHGTALRHSGTNSSRL